MKQSRQQYPREWYRAPALPHGSLTHPGTGALASATRLLGEAAIRLALRERVKHLGVVYSPEDAPEWLEPRQAYERWKSEFVSHLVSPDQATKGFSLEDYPGGYCYIASEWHTAEGERCIVFELRH